MVYGGYNELVNGFINQLITMGPHIVDIQLYILSTENRQTILVFDPANQRPMEGLTSPVFGWVVSPTSAPGKFEMFLDMGF